MPTQGITVRDVTPADAPVIAALLNELGHGTDAAAVPERLKAVRREGGAVLLALDLRGEPLGLLTLGKHTVLHAPGPVGLITALVVSRAVRGKGVGRRLVEAAKAWARERGCVRLMVTSGEQRADAHAFYPACGLAYTGRRFTTTVEPAT